MIGGDIRGLGTAGEPQERTAPVDRYAHALAALQMIARYKGPTNRDGYTRQLSRAELIDVARKALRELEETF